VIELKRILVPTDFSDTSVVAVQYAIALAESLGSTVHVLHVLDNPLAYAWGAEAFIEPPADYYERIEERARERMDQVLSEAQRKKFDAQLVLRTGSPFAEIIEYAGEHAIDLIVMGTHGRGAVAHMLLGSVAERVVRKASCPVLTVREPERPAPSDVEDPASSEVEGRAEPES
jgi:nucleotide-binding universal stress UspA family protein